MQVKADNPIRHSGMTLPELLVVLAILAITVTSIGPSLFGAMEDNRLLSYTDRLKMDMKLAKQEAILRGHRVIICPIAGNDTSACANTTSWTNGWMTFADADGTGSPTSQELDLIQIQDPMPASVKINSALALAQRRVIYTPNGRASIGGSFIIESSSAYESARARRLQWSRFRNPTVSYY